MRPIVALLLCALWLVLPGAPASAELPGERDAAYRAAVELWLQDDELAALQELSRLATQGNAAAQVTLAQIDKTPALQGPALARMPRAERLTLMRKPGGMSGRSWMHAAATQTPLADLWLQLWRPGAGADLAIAFARAGESRAARMALLAHKARQMGGISEIADDPDYPAALRVLVWLEWGDAPEHAVRRAAEIEAVLPGDPQRMWLGESVPDEALADWLLIAPEAAGLAEFCRARCPATVGACALAGFGAMGSHASLLAFGSPSETLIPESDFHASPRGQGALLRRMLLNADARGRRLLLARARERDACLGDLLEAEAQRYMPGSLRD